MDESKEYVPLKTGIYNMSLNLITKKELKKAEEIKITRCLMLYKIIIFLGSIMRFIFQIGEFYTCIILFNIFFELVIIILSSSTIIDNLILALFLIAFSISLGFILIFHVTFIFYEFTLLNWINQVNPFFSIFQLSLFIKICNDSSESKNNNKEKSEKEEDEILIKFLINAIFSIFLIILLIIMIFCKKDYYEHMLFYIILINILKYAMIFSFYLFHSIIVISKIYIPNFINYLKRCVNSQNFCYINDCANVSCFCKNCRFCGDNCHCNYECNCRYKCDCTSNCIIEYNTKIILDPFIFSIIYSFYIQLSENLEQFTTNLKNTHLYNPKLRFFFPINILAKLITIIMNTTTGIP